MRGREEEGGSEGRVERKGEEGREEKKERKRGVSHHTTGTEKENEYQGMHVKIKKKSRKCGQGGRATVGGVGGER